MQGPGHPLPQLVLSVQCEGKELLLGNSERLVEEWRGIRRWRRGELLGEEDVRARLPHVLHVARARTPRGPAQQPEGRDRCQVHHGCGARRARADFTRAAALDGARQRGDAIVVVGPVGDGGIHERRCGEPRRERS